MQISRVLIAICAVAGATSLSPALADSSDWYVGAGVGETTYGISGGDYALPSLTMVHGSQHTEDSATAFRFDLGYRFSRYLAVEGLYSNFGSASSSFTTTTPANHFTGSTKISGEGVGVVGFLPLTGDFEFLGRAGLFRYKSDVNLAIATTSTFPPVFTFSYPVSSTSGTTQYIGVGADYALGRGLTLRAAWDYFRAKDNHVFTPYDTQEMFGVHLLSLELLYSW
ncbi:MAG TPA: outer membrane beta-barrel protein [Gammaproteobacteria bacterium]|nr:outer membrane beta-barrel protein [Gammaproteobacteria bacterium]